MILGIRSKLFVVSFGLVLLSIAAAYFFMRVRLETYLVDSLRQDLAVRARLIALKVSAADSPLTDLKSWDALADELGRRASARVTFIRRDGVVVGDSEVPYSDLAQVENHGSRPEVLEALASNVGACRRFSTTVERPMFYVAVPLRSGSELLGVSRVAVPLTQLDRALGQLNGIVTLAVLISLALALILSSVAAQWASRTACSLTAAARSMAGGNLETRTNATGRDEFGELGRALDTLASNLSTTLEELRCQRDRLSGVLGGMQEGVLMLDSEARIVLLNPALREMLLLPADVEGRSPRDVVPHEEVRDFLAGAVELEAPVTQELELGGRKDQRLLIRAAPLLEPEGGVFAVFVDVTEMRRLENLRRDFVANVSHELRTPVTAIRSAGETLKMAFEQDALAASQFVDIIDRNAERLSGLVEDLLDLSRIESREVRLQMEPLEMREVFSQVSMMFRDRAAKKDVVLLEEVEPGVGTILADRRALENVLTNLVDNAVKYGGTGAEVKLSATREGELVRLGVSDTGPGIEARHLPRLFERFYRVDTGRSRELGGTGLGLSIVKHLVESMGAQVSVQSAPGEGTCFSFALHAQASPPTDVGEAEA